MSEIMWTTSENSPKSPLTDKNIWSVIEKLDLDKRILWLSMKKDLNLKYVETMDELKEKSKFRWVFSLSELHEKFNEAKSTRSKTRMEEILQVLKDYWDNYLNLKIHFAVKDMLSKCWIDGIDEKFLALSESERVMIAKYWWSSRKICFWCGGYFWFYKNPSSCHSCNKWRENTEKAKLDHLLQYTHSREHQIPTSKMKELQKEFTNEYLPDLSLPWEELEQVRLFYKKELYSLENKIKKENCIKRIMSSNPALSSELLVERMDDFISHISDSDISWISIDLDNNIWAYIEWTSRDSRSAWMEYWNYVAVWYNGEVSRHHVVYRDAYKASRDDRSLSFDKATIDSVKIDGEEIHISYSWTSEENSRSYKASFALNKEKNSVTDEEIILFQELFEKKKQEILEYEEKQYAWKTMPTYFLPSEMKFNWMQGGEIPYISPKVQSEYVHKASCTAAIMVYKQIWYKSDGREFGQAGYIINKDWTYSRVSWITVHDRNRLEWNKVIDAKDLLLSNVDAQ